VRVQLTSSGIALSLAEVRVLVPGSAIKQYYYAGGQRIAERALANGANTLYYLAGDHLGSTSATTCGSGCGTAGALLARQLYYPFGQIRYITGTLPTDYGFTGQMLDDTGWMYYNARYYDPYLNRWTQPDTIIPEPGNPQDLNRYSYVRNNPLRHTDSSGHCIDGLTTIPCIVFLTAVAAFAGAAAYHQFHVSGRSWWESPEDAQATFNAGHQASTLALAVDLVILTGGAILCRDGDCTNEVRAGLNTGQQANAPIQSASPANALMSELSQSGVKFNPAQLVRITRAANGQITWLEQGGEKAGLTHILNNHAAQFADRGISASQIPDLLMRALNQGTVIDQVRGGTIYQVIYNDIVQRIMIVTGSNGYIVTAHPWSP